MSSTNPSTGQVCDGKVFIFNTLTNYPSPGGTCAGITLTGGAQIQNLIPLTTGTYTGMLVYQDPACAATMSLSGGAEVKVTGTIYLPNALFQLGGPAKLEGGQIIAKTVALDVGDIRLDFNASTSARPVLPRLAK